MNENLNMCFHCLIVESHNEIPEWYQSSKDSSRLMSMASNHSQLSQFSNFLILLFFSSVLHLLLLSFIEIEDCLRAPTYVGPAILQ